jgi:hypothetical protein
LLCLIPINRLIKISTVEIIISDFEANSVDFGDGTKGQKPG